MAATAKAQLRREEALAPDEVDAFEVPELPTGPEWYRDGDATDWPKYIKNELGEDYLKEAMLGMYRDPAGSAGKDPEVKEKAREIFLNDPTNKCLSARIMQLIGYIRKNKSAAANLVIIRDRCYYMMQQWQNQVRRIESIIEVYNRREGRIVAEKNFIKQKIATERSTTAHRRASEVVRKERQELANELINRAYRAGEKLNRESARKKPKPKPKPIKKETEHGQSEPEHTGGTEPEWDDDDLTI